MPPAQTARLYKQISAGMGGAKKDFACRIQHPFGHNGNPAQGALPGDVCTWPRLCMGVKRR